MLENSNFGAMWNGGVPYLSELKSESAFLPNYYATGHASADNYITMTSGQPPTPRFMGDCQNWSSCVAFERAWPDGGRNITDQIDEAGGADEPTSLVRVPRHRYRPAAGDRVRVVPRRR